MNENQGIEEKSIYFKVIKSSRRKRTVSAKLIEGMLHIYLPEDLCEHEEKRWVDNMLKWAEEQKKKKELNDRTNLEKLAERLNREYLSGRAKLRSIGYVSDLWQLF